MVVPNIDTLKVQLIAQISAISNEEILSQLANILHGVSNVGKPTSLQKPEAVLKGDTTAIVNNSILQKAIRPMPKKLDIDALIAKQRYKGVDRRKFNTLIKKINLTEPLEDLIAAV